MPWCPICKYEYREGFRWCSECGSKLVDDLSQYEKKDDSNDFSIPVFLTHLDTDKKATDVISFLRTFDIPAQMRYSADGGSAYVFFGSSAYGIDLYVPEKLIEEAKQVLAQYKTTDIIKTDISLNEDYFEEAEKSDNENANKSED